MACIILESASWPGTKVASALISFVIAVVVSMSTFDHAAASSAPETPTPPKKIETVIVVAPARQPSAATVDVHGSEGALGDYVAVWPHAAYDLRKDGEVTLSCVVDTYGLAESCSVVTESPSGAGFGRAALELRPTFKLTPAQGPNGPVTSTMAIAIRFKAPYAQFDTGGGSVSRIPNGEGATASSGNQVIGNPLEMRQVTMMDHPIWVQAASFEDLTRSYPTNAGSVEGYAVAHCRVTRSGELAECQTIKEVPSKLGFGAAALRLTRKFRVLPELAQTPAPTPLWVDLPIRFPPPESETQRLVRAPIWLVKFDPTNAPKVFPPEAAAQGLTTGLGVARCLVAPDGGLSDCSPSRGDPDGFGFSEAAVTLASVMKMNLWSADASPVVGAMALISIRLNLK